MQPTLQVEPPALRYTFDSVVLLTIVVGWRKIFYMTEEQKKRRAVFCVFDSLEEENAAESKRLAGMTPHERLREFAVLQHRAFGEKWTNTPIVKRAQFEILSW